MPKSFIFNGTTKHGIHTFVGGVPLGFEDEDAIPYFKACGWGAESDEEPSHIYPAGEVQVDPGTRHNASGLMVHDLIVQNTVETN